MRVRGNGAGMVVQLEHVKSSQEFCHTLHRYARDCGGGVGVRAVDGGDHARCTCCT